MNRISSWSIRHPVPTVVLFLSLLMAGVFGFLPVAHQQHAGHRLCRR